MYRCIIYDVLHLQILEFVKFRDKLKNSFQYASARTERMLLDISMESMR